MRCVPAVSLLAVILAAAGSSPVHSVEARRAADFQPAASATPTTSQQSAALPLRRLPPLSTGTRLSGEAESMLAPVYVTRTEADVKARFRLGTLSSVSVMPETGTLTVSVNGMSIGTVQVGPAYGLRISQLDIPGGLLRPGWNSVGVAARHRHRVDCSVDAADELWTRIDPAETGLMFAEGTSGIPQLADIAAASPRPDGAVPIGIVLDAKRLLNAATVERLARAVQGIALAGRFRQVVVEFDRSGDDGLDLVLGTVADIAGRVDQATLDNVVGATVAVVPGGEKRRPMVVVSGWSEAELDDAIGQLGVISTSGSIPGLKALGGAGGHEINPDGQSLAIGDMGGGVQELFGRTLRTGLDAALPKDFLAADYGRATLDLAGGYAAGLGSDAQIVVAVNGHNAGSVRLNSARGETFLHKRHFLPLSAFRPGQNRIELRVNAPGDAGAGCDMGEKAPPRARVWLNAATKVEFPPLARVGRLPDLAMTASGGFPFAGNAKRATLVVPTPDRATLGAALTVVARLGLAAGRQIPFSFAAAPPAEKSGHVLVVAPARALDPATMRQAQLDPDLVREAWSAAAELPAVPPPAPRGALRRRAYVGDWPDSCAVARRGTEGVDTPQQAAPTDITGAVQTSYGSTGFHHLIAAVRGLSGGEPSAQSRAAALSSLSNASLLVAQGPRETDPDSVVTIVASPNASLLATSVACLVGPSVWSRLSGRLSVLDGTTGAIADTQPETTRYVATQAFSVGNERLMVAGWLSLNPAIFILVAFLLAVPLAATTHFLVRNLGRRNP
jgi:cellulose synthase operon protein B